MYPYHARAMGSSQSARELDQRILQLIYDRGLRTEASRYSRPLIRSPDDQFSNELFISTRYVQSNVEILRWLR